MPMYEYVCAACGAHFEVLQKMTDKSLTQCTRCNADHLEKLVSRSGFRLKGEGWYETDFKGGTETKRNLADDRAEPSSDQSDQTASTTAKSKAAVKPSEAPKKDTTKTSASTANKSE